MVKARAFLDRYRFSLGVATGVFLTIATLASWVFIQAQGVVARMDARERKELADSLQRLPPSDRMAGGDHGQTDYSWPLTSPDGVRHDLGEFRDRVIVLSRWATWCTPCLAELKTVENLSLDLPNVAFLAITTEDVDVIQDHLQRRPMAVEVLISEGGDPSPFGAPVLPTSFVIDCDGQVIFKHVGAANWDSADARQLLGDLVQACHSSVPAAG